MSSSGSIGVFDSGSGGLTVYRALREALPAEDFVYLGDTARLPYGTKSAETVTNYALQAAQSLVEEGIKLLVVACNTASALALASLKRHLPSLPIVGVIEPGALAVSKLSTRGPIAVLATESTVRSGAYEAAILRHKPFAHVRLLAANLLVSVVEEGWTEGIEAETVIKRYLKELGTPGKDFEALVLGCTHFPMLTQTFRKLIGPDIPILDSATTTTEAVLEYLDDFKLRTTAPGRGQSRFLVTDSPERFALLGAKFVPTETFVAGQNVIHAHFGGKSSSNSGTEGRNRTKTGR